MTRTNEYLIVKYSTIYFICFNRWPLSYQTAIFIYTNSMEYILVSQHFLLRSLIRWKNLKIIYSFINDIYIRVQRLEADEKNTKKAYKDLKMKKKYESICAINVRELSNKVA